MVGRAACKREHTLPSEPAERAAPTSKVTAENLRLDNSVWGFERKVVNERSSRYEDVRRFQSRGLGDRVNKKLTKQESLSYGYSRGEKYFAKTKSSEV